MEIALLSLMLLVAATCGDAQVQVPLNPDHVLPINTLFSQAGTMLDGVISLVPENGTSSPIAQLLPGTSSFTLSGRGTYIPEAAIVRVPQQQPFIDVTVLAGSANNSLIASANETHSTPSPSYTLFDFSQLKSQVKTGSFPAIELSSGQELILTSISLYLADIADSFGPPESATTATLAPSHRLIKIPEGATLRLENVAIVASSNDTKTLLTRSLCASSDSWSYAPDVKLTRSGLQIASLTTRAPNATGEPGAGGEVQWRNVLIVFGGTSDPDSKLPCAAATVSDDGMELLRVTQELQNETYGRLYVSMTTDITLPHEDGDWQPIVLQAGGNQLVLLGNPAQPPTLDLSGRSDVWRAQELGSQTHRAVAALYDMTIVNLPYISVRPTGAMSSLVSGLHAFSVNRGTLVQNSNIFRLTMARCQLVVPDMELEFLARAHGRAASDVWPGEPPDGFVLGLQTQNDGQTNPGRLAVSRMQLMSEVQISASALLSASYYSTLPNAVQLWPGSQLWLPQQLARKDEATVHQWGLGGLAVSDGLQSALKLASSKRRAGYNPVQLIGRRSDDSVTSERLTLADLTAAAGGGTSDSTTVARYVVDSFPEDVLGGRVFVNLQGAVNRVILARPITLRNLVLYNLAPGGMYPNGITGAPPLNGSDKAWTGSALPLWYFTFNRSSQNMLNSAASSSPLLQLANVTLLVPEDEWRAMVTAVLRQHAPAAMEAAQQRRRRSSRSLAAAAPPPSSSGAPQQSLYSSITLTALRAFAAASQILSYNYTSRSLVLAEAEHFGWTGTNITITHVLPPDAPLIVPSGILSYQGIDLPYKALSDRSINLDFLVNVSSPPASISPPAAPQTIESSVKPPAAPIPGAPKPMVNPVIHDVTVDTGNDRMAAPGPSDTAAPHTVGHPSWITPVAASVGATVGVVLLLVAVLLALMLRRGSLRAENSTRWSGQGIRVPQKGQRSPFGERLVTITLAAEGTEDNTANTSVYHKPSAGELTKKESDYLRDGVKNRLEASGSSNFGQTPAVTTGATEAVVSEDTMPRTGGPAGDSRMLENFHLAVARALARAADPSHTRTASRRSSHHQAEQELGHDFLFDDDLESQISTLLRGNTTTSLDTIKESVAYFLKSPEKRCHADGHELVNAIRSLQNVDRDEDFIPVSVIGSGSFGVVYRGIWRGLDAALKTLVVVEGQDGQGSGSSTGSARSRAVTEVAISLSMAHPNVVATYTYNLQPLVQQPAPINSGGGVDEMGLHNCYKLYIVQEYCSGGTLLQALDCGMAGSVRAGGLCRRLALHLALDVALGLAHLHSSRIVHGDLKPGNVLLTMQESTSEAQQRWTSETALSCSITAKVADFGLSLLLEQGATHASGRVHGTHAYQAPEVLSSGLLSPRSDVWSFGVMLLELYYGCTTAKMAAINQSLLSGTKPVGTAPTRPLHTTLLEDMLGSSNLPYAKLAAACLAEDPHARPGMIEVVSQLQGLSENFPGVTRNDKY